MQLILLALKPVVRPLRLKTLSLASAAALSFMAFAGMSFTSSEASAQNSATQEIKPPKPVDLSDPSKVVATVNGKDITVGDVIASSESLPPEYANQLPLIFSGLLDRLIDLQLVEDAGRAQGLAGSDAVKALVRDAEAQAVRQTYLEEALESGVTDDSLKAAYDTFIAAQPDSEEVRARHILVEDEATAKDIIKQLEEGGDFAELAKDNSTGPTGPNGGDLGWFTQERMVPAFSEAAFGLKVGEYTKEPVQTRFGYHVILVEGRRPVAPPTFEEMEPELRQQQSEEVVANLIEGLRTKADVEVKDLPYVETPVEDDTQ